MTIVLKLAIFLTLALGVVHIPSSGKSQTSSVVQQLSQIEQRLANAVVERDLQTYSSLLAQDWTTIDLAGRVLTKSQVMEELASKDRRIESATIDEIRVRELGGVAVVTGRTTATGNYQGQRATVELRFTDVFVRRDGRWQVVGGSIARYANHEVRRREHSASRLTTACSGGREASFFIIPPMPLAAPLMRVC